MSNISDEQRQREKAEVVRSAIHATQEFLLRWRPQDLTLLEKFQTDLHELTDIWSEVGALTATDTLLAIMKLKP